MKERSMKEPDSVREIVRHWLETQSYDGLYEPSSCACELSDLMPCCDGDRIPACRPGFRAEPTEEQRENGHTFFIGQMGFDPDSIL